MCIFQNVKLKNFFFREWQYLTLYRESSIKSQNVARNANENWYHSSPPPLIWPLVPAGALNKQPGGSADDRLPQRDQEA